MDRQKVISEEHIALLREPESQYLRNVSLNPGSATVKDISNVILSFLEKNDFDLNFLTAIGCDGTDATLDRKEG